MATYNNQPLLKSDDIKHPNMSDKKRIRIKWDSSKAEGQKLKDLLVSGAIDPENNKRKYILAVKDKYDEFAPFSNDRFVVNYRQLVSDYKTDLLRRGNRGKFLV